MSFSIFYSPQFLLWIAPIVSFSGSRQLNFLMIALAWITFLDFPILADLQNTYPVFVPQFRLIVILITFIRFAMMYVSFKSSWTSRIEQA